MVGVLHKFTLMDVNLTKIKTLKLYRSQISPAFMKSFVTAKSADFAPKSAVCKVPRPTVLSPPAANSPPLTTIGLIKSGEKKFAGQKLDSQ